MHMITADDNIHEGFPVWMLVNGILGMSIPLANYFIVSLAIVPWHHESVELLEAGQKDSAAKKTRQASQALRIVSVCEVVLSHGFELCRYACLR